MIRYMELGEEKLLSSIVMAGSHDAGINEGGKNAKTQAWEIGTQALMGVRLFDVRAAAFYAGGGKVEFKTFHGPKVGGIDRFTPTTGGALVQNAPVMKAKHMVAGTTGQDLHSIFDQAREFVTKTGEFVLLKFDKSDHFPTIAEIARDVVGGALYTGNGCLNEMQLRDLKGKVFVLIMAESWSKMTPQDRAGTLPIYKLKDKKEGRIFKKVVEVATYSPGIPGLQYVGQGGTSPVGFNISHKSTLKENISKQTKLLRKLKEVGGRAAQHQFVMGMMYWTATGTFRSIEKRNKYLWKHSDKLKELWESGVGDWVFQALPPNVVANVDQNAAAYMWKACLPNFVMIDFADQQKCNTIYQFNLAPATQLIQYEM